jgi:hypothetical protein
MRTYDFDAPSNEVPLPVIELVPPPEPELDIIDEDELQTFIEPRKLTWAERRIKMFLDKLQRAEDLNARHPRRGEDNTEFFLPLNFSGDIHFNPFNSVMEHKAAIGQEKTKASVADVPDLDLEEIAPTSNFSDITRKVKHHKITMERERLHLYDTSATEVSPRSWTNVTKTVAVDWEGFLAKEQYNLLKKPEPEPEEDDGEAAFAEEIRKNIQKARMAAYALSMKQKSVMGFHVDGNSSVGTAGPTNIMNMSSSGTEVPGSLVPEDYNTVTVYPLPLGKVFKDTVLPEKYHYYQVAVVDPNCVLTVELKGVHGLADLYLARDHVPNSSRHLMKCNDMSKASEKVCRLVMQTNGYTGYVFLAVYSSHQGCRYQLWAACSGSELGSSDAMSEVNKTIRSLTILANHDDETLHVNFPVLYNEAHNIAEEESKIQHTSILAQMNEANIRHQEQEMLQQYRGEMSAAADTFDLDDGSQASRVTQKSHKSINSFKSFRKPTDEEDDEFDEFDVLDRFVQKVGRRDLKAELTKAGRFPMNQHGATPFLHPEVFIQNGLETVEEFHDYALRPVTPMATVSDDVYKIDNSNDDNDEDEMSDDASPLNNGPRSAPYTEDTVNTNTGILSRMDSEDSTLGSPAVKYQQRKESIEWDRRERLKERERLRLIGAETSGRNSRFSQVSMSSRPQSRTSTAMSNFRDGAAKLEPFTPLTDDSDQHNFGLPNDGGVDDTRNQGLTSNSLSDTSSAAANAYVDLFLSRSTTLPKLPRATQSKSQLPHAGKPLAISKSTSAIVNSSSVPNLPSLQGRESNKSGKKKYDDGLLKQARNPSIVSYTLRKF